MSAAYALLGISIVKGELTLRRDSFAPKGPLVLKSVTWRGKTYEASPLLAGPPAKAGAPTRAAGD